MGSRKTTNQRGNAFQNEVAEFFLAHGCVPEGVHNQKPVARRIFTPKGLIFVSQRNDIFGAFDVIVRFKDRRTKWIQATIHTGIGKKKEDVDKVPYNALYDGDEIWQKIPRKGVRVLLKESTGWKDLGTFNLKKEEDAQRYFQST